MERSKKLALSEHDSKLAGVCGGIGAFFGIDSTLVRLAFVLFTLAGGAGPILYLVLWLVMPSEEDLKSKEELY